MSSKFLLLFFSFFLFISNQNFSQELSIYSSVGYNFPIAQRINSSYQNNVTEFLKSNYSKGTTIDAGLSYLIFENIGIDLNVSYLFGGTKYFSSTFGENNEDFSNSNLSLTPTVLIQTNIGRIIPYAKFGVSINFVRLNLFIDELDYPSYEFSNDYSFGLNAGLGLKFPVNDNFLIFAESSISSFTFYADKVVFTQEINGVKESTEYNLKDKIQDNGYGYLEVIHEFPFSSFNLSFGVAYIF